MEVEPSIVDGGDYSSVVPLKGEGGGRYKGPMFCLRK